MSEKLEKISIENISELLKKTKTDDGTFCSTIYLKSVQKCKKKGRLR